MIRFEPQQRPAERVRMLTEGARAASTLPSVRRLAATLCADDEPRPALALDAKELDAYALLAAVQRPRWKGDTERDTSRGQWTDTNVERIVSTGGDCTARSFALVALLTARGFDARAVWCSTRDSLDHCIVGVTLFGRLVYGDPSGVHGYGAQLPIGCTPLA